VRRGEALSDVMAKRAITRAEMEALNANINLDRLKGGGAGLGLGRGGAIWWQLPCNGTTRCPCKRPSGCPNAVHAGAAATNQPTPINLHTNQDYTQTRNANALSHPPPPEGQLLKLPANKFTVREREMLIGSGIVPPEFFAATKNPFVLGAGAREWGWGLVGFRGTCALFGAGSVWESAHCLCDSVCLPF
jgi:hypothetical protein